jgi:hypothetical protein
MVAPTSYCFGGRRPGIPFHWRFNFLRGNGMDARIKSGHDERQRR